MRRVAQGRKCGAFAGVCVVLLLSGAFVGMAMMARGDSFLDLVDEGAVNWKVKDVMDAGEDWPIQMWDYRNPTEGYLGLGFPFNHEESKWYTAYLDNVWEGDLTGLMVTAKFTIVTEGGAIPVFEARRDDVKVQLKLHFTSTGGAYEASDMWWSLNEFVLTEYDRYYDDAQDKYVYTHDQTYVPTVCISVTLSAVLSPDQWSNLDGVLGTKDRHGFAEAVSDIHEIGLSFGRGASLASGVALTTEVDATFVLESFEIGPA